MKEDGCAVDSNSRMPRRRPNWKPKNESLKDLLELTTTPDDAGKNGLFFNHMPSGCSLTTKLASIYHSKRMTSALSIQITVDLD